MSAFAKAIIVTPQLPDYDYNAEEPWQKAQSILDAYRQGATSCSSTIPDAHL